MAVGAPLAILREMQHAARRARACRAAPRGGARSFGAATTSFAALPALAPRALDLAGVARTCLEEACVDETVAVEDAVAAELLADVIAHAADEVTGV